MSDLDGDRFYGIDQDAYSADRPVNTAEDNLIRNQLQWLQEQGQRVGRPYVRDLEKVPQFSTLNRCAFAYTLAYIEEWKNTYNIRMILRGNDSSPWDWTSDFELTPFFYFFGSDTTVFGQNRTVDGWVSDSQGYDLSTFDTSLTDVPVKMSGSLPSESGLALVGVTMELQLRTGASTTSTQIQGSPSSATFSTTPTATSETACFYNANDPSLQGDLLLYDSNGFDTTSDAENLAYTDTFRPNFSSPVDVEWIDTIWMTPISWSIEFTGSQNPADSVYPRDYVRPNKEVEFARGGGAPQQTTKTNYSRRRLSSIDLPQPGLPSDGGWERYPIWHWGDSDGTSPEIEVPVPHSFETEGAVTGSIHYNFVVLPVRRDYNRQTKLTSSITIEETVDVTFKLRSYNGGGISTTDSFRMDFTPPEPRGRRMLTQQAFLQIETDRSTNSTTQRYTNAQGLLCMDDNAQGYDTDLLQAGTVIEEGVSAVNDTDPSQYYVGEFSIQNPSEPLRLYLIAHSIQFIKEDE